MVMCYLMSIILDKIIICKLNGDVSIKNNCQLCNKINFVYFRKTIDGKKELTNFSCNYFIGLKEVIVE